MVLIQIKVSTVLHCHFQVCLESVSPIEQVQHISVHKDGNKGYEYRKVNRRRTVTLNDCPKKCQEEESTDQVEKENSIHDKIVIVNWQTIVQSKPKKKRQLKYQDAQIPDSILGSKLVQLLNDGSFLRTLRFSAIGLNTHLQ